MATRTLTIIAVSDIALGFANPSPLRLREGRTHKVHLGQYISQGIPPTVTFAIAEATTGAESISNVGISATKDGVYGDSVTLTLPQAVQSMLSSPDEDQSTLWIQFTLADVDADTTIELEFTDTEP